MINSVTFWDRMRATDHEFDGSDCVISITDPDKLECPINGTSNVLRLAFHDVVEVIRTADITMVPMLRHQAVAIVQQLHEWQEDSITHNVIVHCEAGASRSAAVALYVYAYTGCKFATIGGALYANSYIIEKFRQVSPMQLGANWHIEVLHDLI